MTAPKELNEVPEGRSTTVISPSDLPRATTSVKELIEMSPGAYVSKGIGQGDREMISIRGFTANQVRVLIDGVPADEGGSSSLNLNTIPTAIIDKVIISRGPLSSLYGTGAMGGIINIITKNSVHESGVGLLYGSYSTYGLNGQTFQAFGKDKLSLSGYLRDTNGRYTFVNPYTGGLYGNNGPNTIAQENNSSTEAGGEASYQANNEAIPFKITSFYGYKNLGIPGLLGQAYQNIRERSDLVRAKVEATAFEKKLGLVGYLNFTDRHYTDPNGERDGFPEDYKRAIWTEGVKAKPEFQISDNIRVPLEFAFQSESFRDSNLQANRDTVTANAQMEASLWDDQVIVSPSFSVSKASQFSTQTSAGVSAVYKPIESLSFKANANTGFRYPGFDELYLTKGIIVGNATLLPEETFGGDLGIEFKNRIVSAGVTYFLYSTKNLIEYMLISGFQYKPFNFGKTLTEGFEISTKFEPTKGITFKSALTFQDVLDQQEGDFYGYFIPGRPRTFGTMSIDVRPCDRSRLFSVFNFALGRYINISNSQELSDRYEWDAGVNYEFSHKINASFEVKNLLNRNNVDVRGFPLPGRAFYASTNFVF